MSYVEAHHNHCESPWVCEGCEENICPRCEPSPAEQVLCAACYWIEDSA